MDSIDSSTKSSSFSDNDPKQHSHSSNPLAQLYFIKDKFNQMPAQKQFAFVSLVALGTSMLITGRSVRAIMKRASTATPESSELEMMSKTKIKKAIELTNTEEQRTSAVNMMVNKMDETKFWDNKSLVCVKDRVTNREQERDMEIKFNPALDAVGAFTLATILVIGASTWTIKLLSNRWQLDTFDDWRIFIESGYLAQRLIPENFSNSISRSIPNRLRTSHDDLQNQNQSPLVPTSTDLQLKDFIQTFDQEWEIEKNRREIQRIQWENQRKIQGKKVWSD